jgi:hypothetical protein
MNDVVENLLIMVASVVVGVALASSLEHLIRNFC